MATAFLAGLFSPELCDIKLFDELYSGPLEDEKLLSFPDMLVLTGLNAAFDRMLQVTAYVRSKNKNAVVVAGGPAIRALPHYAKRFFDYCCTGDIEQLREVIEDAFGAEYVAASFLEKGWAIPRYDLAYWTTFMNYVESSRNCYFNCNFCSLTGENAKYQAYDIEYLRQQFTAQFMAAGKQRVVHFLDNTFASLDRDLLLDRFALLRAFWQEGYFEKWSAEVTSDFFLREENLELALHSGCLGLFCGIESFDHKTLLNFRKSHNTRLPQVEMIRNCLNAGITFLYGLVFDVTSRPVAELREELDFVVGNPEITLPSFITLAIPLLKSPFFYECLNAELFLPNIKLRDLDGTTLVLRPQGSLHDTVQFVRDLQTLRGYQLKIIQHMKNFYRLYRNKLAWDKMVLAQFNALLLCTPKLSTAASDLGRILLNGSEKPCRTFVGSTEPPDSCYRPAFWSFRPPSSASQRATRGVRPLRARRSIRRSMPRNRSARECLRVPAKASGVFRLTFEMRSRWSRKGR